MDLLSFKTPDHVHVREKGVCPGHQVLKGTPSKGIVISYAIKSSPW